MTIISKLAIFIAAAMMYVSTDVQSMDAVNEVEDTEGTSSDGYVLTNLFAKKKSELAVNLPPGASSPSETCQKWVEPGPMRGRLFAEHMFDCRKAEEEIVANTHMGADMGPSLYHMDWPYECSREPADSSHSEDWGYCCLPNERVWMEVKQEYPYDGCREVTTCSRLVDAETVYKIRGIGSANWDFGLKKCSGKTETMLTGCTDLHDQTRLKNVGDNHWCCVNRAVVNRREFEYWYGDPVAYRRDGKEDALKYPLDKCVRVSQYGEVKED